jgi:hypothetical protein
VVVCGPGVGGIPELVETGFCLYDLQRLQDEFANQTVCAALEVDFFRADAIADIKDDRKVAQLALRAVAATLDVPILTVDDILEVSVIRARNAVSHFCVNSAQASPPVRADRGLYLCGDWIDRTGHASWSTEKAVVTGRQAANALAEDFGLDNVDVSIIPAAPDTPQLAALRQVAGFLRQAVPSGIIPPSPWVLLKQLSGR